MFITRTRLVLYGDLVGGVRTARAPAAETVAFTSAVGTVVGDVSAAMALIPPGSRPPSTDWWRYRLEWLVQSHVLPTIRGVVPDTGRLVFDVDLWETAAQQQAAQQPLRRNTFVHEFSPKQLAGSGPIILGEIDDYLVRAEFGGYPADGRDPRIVVTTDPARDPLALLTRPAIADTSGVYRTLPAAWRSPA